MLKQGSINYIIVPRYANFDSIVKTSDTYINYYLNNLSNKIVLRMGNDEKLNTIVSKLLEIWLNDRYRKDLESSLMTYYEESGNITVNIPGECLNQNSHVGHELQHAFQFEKGELSILPESAGKLPYLYDLNDEIEAYEVTNIVQSGKMYFLSPNSKSTEETLNRKGIPQKYNYKWSVDDIKEIGNYYHLPEENLKIREERKQEIIEILKERNEYYNKNL